MAIAPVPDITLDLRGLQNPEPILRLAAEAATWQPRDTVRVLADDKCFANDFLRWCVGSELDLVSLRYPSNGETEITVRVPRGVRGLST
ncbi:MAG: sulfurtransferase TusA family protein [Candidatus Dormibacteria bacterium]